MGLIIVFLPIFPAVSFTKYGSTILTTSASSEWNNSTREPSRVASASMRRMAVWSVGAGVGEERLYSSPI
jgi:hypothetical protein